MKPIGLHPEAEVELDAAIAYLNAQRPDLGKDFRDEVVAAWQLIQKFPRIGTLIQPPAVRRRAVRRFHYNLIYLEQPQEITIIAVAHPKRQSGYWVGRIP